MTEASAQAVPAKRNQEIREFCQQEFPLWLYSRSKYVKRLPLNILEQFQPQKSYEERDYANSPFCAAFYLSLMLKVETDVQKATAFLYVFFPKARPEPVKSLAHRFAVDRDTVYLWAHDTAVDIFRLATINCRLQDMRRDDKFNFEVRT